MVYAVLGDRKDLGVIADTRRSDPADSEPLRMNPPLDHLVAARPGRTLRPATIRLVATRLVALVLPAALLTVHSVRSEAGCDYVAFHAAASLLAKGENPYGIDEQIRAQRPLRRGPDLVNADSGDPWRRRGYLPYFYPPWLALACVPLVGLSFPVAKATWIYLGSQCLALSGYGLREASGRLPAAVSIAIVLMFMPSYDAIQVGQTPPLLLLLLVASWWLLERGWDRGAGIVLALSTFKPQLTVVVIPAALLWAARRGRWGVPGGFAAMLALLGLGCGLLAPSWPLEMLLAPSRTPIPIAITPSVGVTWLSLLRSLGIAGWPLVAAYALAALPIAAIALFLAWDRERPPSEAMSVGVIAAFFVSPYALCYDLTVLLFPLLLVLPSLSERAALWLLCLVLIVPYLHLTAIVGGTPQVTLFWLPAGVALLWIIRELHGRVAPVVPIPLGINREPCAPRAS
jgi:hypothetical protein